MTGAPINPNHGPSSFMTYYELTFKLQHDFLTTICPDNIHPE